MRLRSAHSDRKVMERAGRVSRGDVTVGRPVRPVRPRDHSSTRTCSASARRVRRDVTEPIASPVAAVTRTVTARGRPRFKTFDRVVGNPHRRYTRPFGDVQCTCGRTTLRSMSDTTAAQLMPL